MSLLLLLVVLALFVPSPVLAGGEKATDIPRISYFRYLVSYNEKTAHSGEHKNISYELTSGRMNIYGPLSGSNFCGPVDNAVFRELSALVSELDLQDWEGASPENDFYDLRQKNDSRNYVWTLTIIFTASDSEHTPQKIHFSGMDDGLSSKRLKAEAALTRFFLEQGKKAQATVPRHVADMVYTSGRAADAISYSLSAGDGRVTLSRTAQNRDVSEYVNEDVLSRLNMLIRDYKLDDWHGFTGADFEPRAASAFELRLRFDTEQEIFARGNIDRAGGTPPHFAEADAALRALLNTALGLDASSAACAENAAVVKSWLRDFSFSTHGMSAGDGILYEIYRRRDADGLHMILRRRLGVNGDAVETVLDNAALDNLKMLFSQQNLADWNGFHGNASGVLDGTGFGLSIRFTDGTSIMAGGENKFPHGYRECKEALFQYFDTLLAHTSGVKQ